MTAEAEVGMMEERDEETRDEAGDLRDETASGSKEARETISPLGLL